MISSEQKIGPYKLIKPLGYGGCGEVWLATWQTHLMTRPVAIKLPKTSEIYEKLLREEAVLWLQAIGHENIHPFIEANKYGEQIVITSEFAPEGSLGKLLKEEKKLEIEQILDISIGILAGLKHLHERKIIHRDLKPDNILMQNGKPRLTDFGLSRIMRDRSFIYTNFAGSCSYMAPESFESKAKAKFSVQTDIWAVGVIIYEMLTGRKPFQQDNIMSLAVALATEKEPPLPDNTPPFLQLLVDKALAKKPKERFESAAAMFDALRKEAYPYLSGLVFDFSRNEKAKEKGNAERNKKASLNRSDESLIREIKSAIKVKPGNATAYIQLGQILIEQKKFAQAVELMNQAIELKFSNAQIYNLRGIAYKNLEEYERAISDYTKAIELDPTDAKFYNNRGITYRNLKEYKKAIADYTKAVELDPTDATSYNNRGVVLKILGYNTLAKKDYLKALELNPNYSIALGNLKNLSSLKNRE